MKKIEKETFLKKIEISNKIRYVNSFDLKSVQKTTKLNVFHVPQFNPVNKLFLA